MVEVRKRLDAAVLVEAADAARKAIGKDPRERYKEATGFKFSEAPDVDDVRNACTNYLLRAVRFPSMPAGQRDRKTVVNQSRLLAQLGEVAEGPTALSPTRRSPSLGRICSVGSEQRPPSSEAVAPKASKLPAPPAVVVPASPGESQWISTFKSGPLGPFLESFAASRPSRFTGMGSGRRPTAPPCEVTFFIFFWDTTVKVAPVSSRAERGSGRPPVGSWLQLPRPPSVGSDGPSMTTQSPNGFVRPGCRKVHVGAEGCPPGQKPSIGNG